jgi:hypothetical protein
MVTECIRLLQYLITIHLGVIVNSYSPQFTRASNLSSRSAVPHQSSGIGLQRENVTRFGFPNCTRVAATLTLDSQCTQLWNSSGAAFCHSICFPIICTLSV